MCENDRQEERKQPEESILSPGSITKNLVFFRVVKFPRGFGMNTTPARLSYRRAWDRGSAGGIHRRFKNLPYKTLDKRFDETGGTTSSVINQKSRGLCTTIG